MCASLVIPARRHSGGLALMLFLVVGMALALPAGARAGCIESRFTAPSPPDLAWENAYDPQASQDKVAQRVPG